MTQTEVNKMGFVVCETELQNDHRFVAQAGGYKYTTTYKPATSLRARTRRLGARAVGRAGRVRALVLQQRLVASDKAPRKT